MREIQAIIKLQLFVKFRLIKNKTISTKGYYINNYKNLLEEHPLFACFVSLVMGSSWWRAMHMRSPCKRYQDFSLNKMLNMSHWTTTDMLRRRIFHPRPPSVPSLIFLECSLLGCPCLYKILSYCWGPQWLISQRKAACCFLFSWKMRTKIF